MLSRPRVTHLTPALFGDAGVYGGAERYSYELARHMARVVPTRLVCFGERDREFVTEEGLAVRVYGRSWTVRRQEFNRWHSGILREVLACDILHCHQPRMLAPEVAALLARLCGTRVYATDLGGGGWGCSAYFSTDKWFHGHLHISEYSRRQSRQECSSRAQVIYGGIDHDRFSPDLSSGTREALVVFVGRLMPHKGVEILIDALPEDLVLEVIGRPYHAEYEADLRRRSAGKSVIFRSDCSDAAIVTAYRRAIAVVLPSVYRDMYGQETQIPELLGQTPLEGMSCGTPAIVSDAASLPEVVLDGETGFVVPVNDTKCLRDKLVWLRDHRDAVDRMGMRGRDWVMQRFSWPVVVKKCLSAYMNSNRSPEVNAGTA